MPLPPNNTLSLLGCSRPGDALHSKPKQAMLVRMSSETLDALESFSSPPVVQFEFAENPGIYIGDVFYPMRNYQETSIHEIYLRTSSVAKKTAPLKLYASVVGKFAVERDLADVSGKVRESTQEAVHQRSTRTTVLIDHPREQIPLKKKKDHPSMFLSKSKAPATSSLVPQPKLPVSPSQTPNDTIRKSTIQCLASGEKTEEQLIESLSKSSNHSFRRREIQEILDQVAEPVTVKGSITSKSSRQYRLKPVIWKEVRPHEWSLSETERTAMARSARIMFQSLGIPQSDPIWNHVQYRGSVSMYSAAGSNDQSKASPSASTSEGKAKGSKIYPPKHGLIRKEKSTPKPKAEMIIKDESPRAFPRTKAEVGQLNSDNGRRVTETKNTTRQALTATKMTKSIGPADSLPINGNGPNANPGKEKDTLPKARHDGGAMIESERRKQLSQTEKSARVEGSGDHLGGFVAKRKNIEDHRDASSAATALKKRKIEPQAVSSSCSTARDAKPRQEHRLSQSHKDINSGSKSRKSMDLTSIAQPLSQSSHSKTSSVSGPSIKSNSLTKSRRRRSSPIYTSSDEEDTPLCSRLYTKIVSSPTSRTTNTNTDGNLIPVKDHSALRARYNASYLEYIQGFQRLLEQKAKIERLLMDTALDSDGDVELLDPEELAQLVTTYKNLEERLRSIRSVFTSSLEE